MGNRAVIAFKNSNTGIYLHWNGGVESVLAFIRAARELGVRNCQDSSYCIARLTQIIGNFFGGTISLGVESIRKLDTDNGDNGVFYIDENWNIYRRKHNRSLVTTVAGLSEDQRQHYEAVYQKVMEKNKEIFGGR